MILQYPGDKLLIPGGAARATQLGGAPLQWWQSGGASGCVAAYLAKGAASQAVSYVNLANPGTYDLTASAAPTWNTATGWTFNGTTQFLKTGVLPGINYSAIIQYANQPAANNAYLFGAYDGNTILGFRSFRGIGTAVYANGNTASSVAGPTAGGNRAVTNRGYKDGVDDVASSLTPAAVTREIYIGGLNNSGSAAAIIRGDIIAIAIYNNLLSPSTVLALAAAMAAL